MSALFLTPSAPAPAAALVRSPMKSTFCPTVDLGRAPALQPHRDEDSLVAVAARPERRRAGERDDLEGVALDLCRDEAPDPGLEERNEVAGAHRERCLLRCPGTSGRSGRRRGAYGCGARSRLRRRRALVVVSASRREDEDERERRNSAQTSRDRHRFGHLAPPGGRLTSRVTKGTEPCIVPAV